MKALVVSDVVCVIPLVREPGAWPRRDGVRQVDRDLGVVGLAGGDEQAKRMAVRVGVGMELGREAASRAPKTLRTGPPFAPAAQ